MLSCLCSTHCTCVLINACPYALQQAGSDKAPAASASAARQQSLEALEQQRKAELERLRQAKERRQHAALAALTAEVAAASAADTAEVAAVNAAESAAGSAADRAATGAGEDSAGAGAVDKRIQHGKGDAGQSLAKEHGQEEQQHGPNAQAAPQHAQSPAHTDNAGEVAPAAGVAAYQAVVTSTGAAAHNHLPTPTEQQLTKAGAAEGSAPAPPAAAKARHMGQKLPGFSSIPKAPADRAAAVAAKQQLGKSHAAPSTAASKLPKQAPAIVRSPPAAVAAKGTTSVHIGFPAAQPAKLDAVASPIARATSGASAERAAAASASAQPSAAASAAPVPPIVQSKQRDPQQQAKLQVSPALHCSWHVDQLRMGACDDSITTGNQAAG